MKKIFVLFCLLIFTLNAFSQTPEWNWARIAGASGDFTDLGYGISTDFTGNIYVTGYFKDTATFGSYPLTSSGDSDIFVAKLDPNGNWLWVKKAGSSGTDVGKGVSTDTNGNVYVTGYFQNTASFGSFDLVSFGGKDIFVSKLDTKW